MANKNITALTAAATTLAGTELVPAWDGVGANHDPAEKLA